MCFYFASTLPLRAEILRCKIHFRNFSRKKHRHYCRRFCTVAISIARSASDQAQVSVMMCQSEQENERASEIARCSFPRVRLAVDVEFRGQLVRSDM